MADVVNTRYLFDDKYYLDFERSFAYTDEITFFARKNPFIPIYTVALYLLFVLTGPMFMKYREPLRVKPALSAWNGALSLFSFCGAIRTAPVLYQYVMSSSIVDIICRPADIWIVSGPTGLWVTLFLGSKFPELIDTIFLVIRKKPVPFLHWFHHATTLLYSWHACAYPANYALSFVVMNYCVHSIMYAYYSLIILGKKPAWLSALFITTSQITQMFVGMSIQICAAYFYFHPAQCNVSGYNILAGGIMYSMYFYLFVKFACRRYSNRSQKNKKVM